jgi:hypothetical protein
MPNLNRVLFGLGAVFGIAALVGVLIFVHTRAVSKYGNERYEAGKADAYAAVEHKAHEQELKDNARAAQLRERNDADNRNITADAAMCACAAPEKQYVPVASTPPPPPADLSRPVGPPMLPWLRCLTLNGPLSPQCHSMIPQRSQNSVTPTAQK